MKTLNKIYILIIIMLASYNSAAANGDVVYKTLVIAQNDSDTNLNLKTEIKIGNELGHQRSFKLRGRKHVWECLAFVNPQHNVQIACNHQGNALESRTVSGLICDSDSFLIVASHNMTCHSK